MLGQASRRRTRPILGNESSSGTKFLNRLVEISPDPYPLDVKNTMEYFGVLLVLLRYFTQQRCFGLLHESENVGLVKLITTNSDECIDSLLCSMPYFVNLPCLGSFWREGASANPRDFGESLITHCASSTAKAHERFHLAQQRQR